MFRTLSRPVRFCAIIVWLAWALLLAGGLAARVFPNAKVASLETELKASSSLALVVAAWRFVCILPPASRRVSFLIAIGMTLGCLGDATPMLGAWWPDPQRTLGNMMLFGSGHAAYIRACWLLYRDTRRSPSGALWYGSLALWLMTGGAVWYFAAYTGTQQAVMRIPALAYTLLLSATAGGAMSVALISRCFLPVFVGAVLFLVSDVLLGVWIFHDLVFRPFDLVWLSYGLGQMLIVFGTAAFVGSDTRWAARYG
jgi:hypothetical protein